MKRFPGAYLVLVFIAFILLSCKNDAADARQKQDDALQGLEKSLEGLKEGNKEVVDFRILKEALPDNLLGMKRISHDGQKTSMAGMSISMAEAAYEEGDKRMSISIMDTGGLGAVMARMAAWSTLEMDKESEEGYERTTLIDGKKAYEKYNRISKEGQIAVISADRFMVTIDGTNISEVELRQAISKIKIKG